ncbi:hypothetical protein QFC21_006393 [Naganishia friedmannii]|uniref:Uncharacterized protein n=1 Tax=Naganishia friedmannii TaxID=89922 RepID=A0ACC2V3F8_9TREE|nr:hypothetical protein QFC21_006393 [Naganishia friedmannii]
MPPSKSKSNKQPPPPARTRKPPKRPTAATSDPFSPSYTPSTHSETLDAGVLVEEKGEKFRFSDPLRAGRWYGRAGELYQVAREMQGAQRGDGWDAGALECGGGAESNVQNQTDAGAESTQGIPSQQPPG